MSLYHVNGKGEPGICKALSRCPFGAEAHEECATLSEARTWAERKLSEELGGSFAPDPMDRQPGESVREATLRINGRTEQQWAELKASVFDAYASEVGEAYAQATRRLVDELETTYPAIIARTRAVFMGSNFVLKVPITDDGISDSSREARTSQAYQAGKDVIPMALTEELESEERVYYVKAEKVRPARRRDGHILPSWAGMVDCEQVGHNAAGVLVAYDL